MRRSLVVPAAGALLVTACTDGQAPVSPDDPEEAQQAALSADDPALTVDTELETTGKHLVLLQRHGLPSGFGEWVAEAGGEVDTAFDAMGIAVVSDLPGDGPERLQERGPVRAVVPDYLLSLAEPVQPPSRTPVREPTTHAEPADIDPSEAPFFPAQWHLQQIQADEAWAAGATGSQEVTAAILDTGIGYTHPDLAGLVDLDNSISLVPSDDELVEQVFGPDVHPVADLNWHGTHVAATVSSNAALAAGVSAETRLLGVKVCNVEGACATSAILEGLLHAAGLGADVANLSLGGISRHRASPGFISVVERAVNHAAREGTVLVVAAGNDALHLDEIRDFHHLFCEVARSVCTSGSAPGDVLWEDGDFGSNVGSAVDVAAPATGVIAACSPFTLVPALEFCRTGEEVIGAFGTSMASPHAAGVAALIAADGVDEPGRVAERLRQTADVVSEMPGQRTTTEFGRGRVNAARAAGVF